MLSFLYADNLNQELATVCDLICEEVNCWAIKHKELSSNELHSTIDPKFMEKYPNICCNKLAHLVYILNGWGSFIEKQESSFLKFNVYSLIQQYNISNNMRVAMHKRLRKIVPGDVINQPVKITDFFYFVNLKPNENQSIYDVREVVESTMFDLFDVYLDYAINKGIALQQSIKSFIQNGKCRIDEITLKVALEQIDIFDRLIFTVSNVKSSDPEKYKVQFNKQLNWIASQSVAGDLVHITFGIASRENIQDNKNQLLFPLQISDAGTYNWLDNCILGSFDSNYFGLHIDSHFVDQKVFSNFLVNNGLYKLTNQGKLDYYEELKGYTNPIFVKRNMFLFNSGKINFNLRTYSKKIANYYFDEPPVDITIEKLEQLLQNGIVLVLASHISPNDEILNVVGPFLLENILELKRRYPNFNIVFHDQNGIPYLFAEPKLSEKQEIISEKAATSYTSDSSKELLVFHEKQEMTYLCDLNNNSFNSQLHCQPNDVDVYSGSFPDPNLNFTDQQDTSVNQHPSSFRCVIF